MLNSIGLFNLRGSDQGNSPFFTSLAIITPTENILFAGIARITEEIKSHITDEGTTLTYKSYTNDEITKVIEDVVKTTTGKILVPVDANAGVLNLIPENRCISDYSPIEATKSIKNIVEADGMVVANKRDSVAVIKYLHWLEENVNVEEITELSGAEKLLEFRKYKLTVTF